MFHTGFSVHHQELKNRTYSVRYLSDQYCYLLLAVQANSRKQCRSDKCLTLYVRFWAPDGGRKTRLKHVERLTERNKLWNVASCWLYSANIHVLAMQDLWMLKTDVWALSSNLFVSCRYAVRKDVLLEKDFPYDNVLTTEKLFLIFGNNLWKTEVNMNCIYRCNSYRTNFAVLLTVHLSIFNSVINQLDAQNFCFTISLFHASTCFEHHVLISRRSKLYYTASGIITPIGGRLVHKLREDSLNLCTRRPPISVTIPEAV